MRLVGIAVSSLVLLSACSSGRDIHGAKRALLIDEAFNEIFVGYDLSGEDYRTFVQKSDGEYEESIAAVFSDGVFIVENVTEDQYLLLRRTSNPPVAELYLSSSDDIDLSDAELGRPGQVIPAPETFLELDITGLSPWESGDRLELVGVNLGVIADLIQGASTGTPAVGADAIDSLTVDLAARGIPLFNADLGDHFAVAQLEQKTDADLPYRALTKIFNPPAGNIISAMRTVVSGNFVDVPQNSSRSIAVSGASFAAMAATVHANAVPANGFAWIQTLPAAAQHGFYYQGPELASFSFSGENTTVDLTYGDPYPSNWDDLLVSIFDFDVAYTASGATSSTTISAQIITAGILGEVLAPGISPVRDVHISQVRADKPLAGVGDAPVIAWNAPATGTPAGYRIVAYELSRAENGSTAIAQFVTVYTKDLGFRFPSASFPPGEYVMEIIALEDPGMDLERAPHRTALPSSNASMLTPIFQP
jgi:hypothetical protein